jgi:hypothetical protein
MRVAQFEKQESQRTDIESGITMVNKLLQENANSTIRCNFALEMNITDVSNVSFAQLNPHKHSTADSITKE